VARRRRCRFCGEIFVPDRRLKGRQYACGSAACQRERHRLNCAAWNDDHRAQFRGRYPQTQTWLAEHAGYLESYRDAHPEVRERHRVTERERWRRRRRAALDIQDAISIQTLSQEEVVRDNAGLDIQDSIWSYLFVLIGLVAVNGRLDRQDSMARRPPALYACGREIWQWATRERARREDATSGIPRSDRTGSDGFPGRAASASPGSIGA
jgi:hypothetical protein